MLRLTVALFLEKRHFPCMHNTLYGSQRAPTVLARSYSSMSTRHADISPPLLKREAVSVFERRQRIQPLTSAAYQFCFNTAKYEQMECGRGSFG